MQHSQLVPQIKQNILTFNMERSDRVQMVIDGKAASYGAVAPAPANSGGSEQISEAQLKMERSLWWWNLSCGILHLVQAVVVLGLGEERSRH